MNLDDRIVRVEQIDDAWGLNMLLYGQSGVGKTTLAATANLSELGKPCLFLDVGAGTRSLPKAWNVDVFVPQTWSDFAEIYAYIGENLHRWKTIVIDTISEAQQLNLQTITRNAGRDIARLDDYLLSTNQMIRMVTAFRSLATMHGLNVIFIAHEREDKDETTGAILIRPDMTASVAKDVVKKVDAVGRLIVTTSGRELRFVSGPNAVGKFRQPPSAEPMPTTILNPTMVELLDFYRKSVDGKLDELAADINFYPNTDGDE